jgi:hypothetical protein
MKSFMRSFLAFCEALGQARAAASLTRAGKIEEAKAIYGK